MNWISYTVLGGIMFTIGEYFSKRYVMDKAPLMLLLSMIAYIINLVFWYEALDCTKHLSSMSLTWTAMYAVLGLAVGIVVFKETLSLQQIVGVTLAIIGMCMINK